MGLKVITQGGQDLAAKIADNASLCSQHNNLLTTKATRLVLIRVAAYNL